MEESKVTVTTVYDTIVLSTKIVNILSASCMCTILMTNSGPTVVPAI